MVKIVTLHKNSDGVPYLATGSPHAYGSRGSWLHEALRSDLSTLRIEPAPSVFRNVHREEPYPHPETCTPYRAASGLGLMLRTRLPLLIVKTPQGHLLPDARTALAYALENAERFAEELALVESYSPSVLDPEVAGRYRAAAPQLFRDLAQPYSTFAQGYFSIPAGFYVETTQGIGTAIGPPINRSSPLPVQTGLIETDWHHHALFAVVRYPTFEGKSLVVLPHQDLAQVWFVAYEKMADIVVEHSIVEAGGKDGYEAHWNFLVEQLAQRGLGETATLGGVSSVMLDCLHCRVSVTRAAESGVPDDHKVSKLFVAPYKVIRREHRKRVTDHERSATE